MRLRKIMGASVIGWLWCMVLVVACGLTEQSREPSAAPGSGTATVGTSGATRGSGGDGGDGGGGVAGTSGSGTPEAPWQPLTELPEPGAVVSDFASGAVALHAGTAALGTLIGSIDAVHVFHKDGVSWVEEPLAPGIDTLESGVGSSVAVFEDTLLVGAPNGRAGSVVVFERADGTWTETRRLSPMDSIEGDGFGVSVALSDATAVVGGRNGAAHVFAREADEWHEEQRLVLDEGEDGDFELVGGVAVDGDTAVLSARSEDAVAAYVFVRSLAGWQLEQRLVPELVGDRYRPSVEVAVSGDTVLVATSEARELAGSVHLFSREAGEWREEQLLLGADYVDHFGHASALHGDVVLVATYDVGDYSGSVYVFERTVAGWTLAQELVSPRGYSDGFGSSIAVFEDTALVAAPGQGEFDEWAGSAYWFTRIAEP